MKTYAIKTPQGYFASQGNSTWIQSTPDGWAAFTERTHAENLMKAKGVEGTVEEFGEPALPITYHAIPVLVYVPVSLGDSPGHYDTIRDTLRDTIPGCRVFAAEDFDDGTATETDETELSARIAVACPRHGSES